MHTHPRRCRPAVEPLEPRDVPALHALGLSPLGLHPLAAPPKGLHPLLHPLSHVLLRPAAGPVVTPSLLRALYHVPPGLTGAGQTITVVDAYDDPGLRASVDLYDALTGLPPVQLTESTPYGIGSTTPDNLLAWRIETCLDVEMAHALAPGAKITVVHARSDNDADFFAGYWWARTQTGASVVTDSAGEDELDAATGSPAVSHAYDAAFVPLPGQMQLWAAGDNGGIDATFPSTNPNVLSVGGTVFDGRHEIASLIGGGGPSALYRAGRHPRRTPDVSALAENILCVCTDVADVAAFPGGPPAGNPVLLVAGTSASTPEWGGVLAVVNEGRALRGEAPLFLPGQITAQRTHHGLTDITRGSSVVYAAGPGYDQVTGWGSPRADRLR